MSGDYLWLKLLHIFVAVVALGTSAGLGILLEFYGTDREHGPFVLRAIERLILFVVLPGFVLMLASGLWMVSLAWPWTARWIQLALGLWAFGLVSLGASIVALRRQRREHALHGRASARHVFASRATGAVFGLVVAATLYLMVFKV